MYSQKYRINSKKENHKKERSPESQFPNGMTGFAWLYDNLIGKDATFKGPFGHRPITYCDYTASARPVRYIEDFISDHVLPFYANTHTATSMCGLQTSRFREEARQMIKSCVNGTDEDVVIFTGAGVTGCFHKIISVLQLNDPNVAKNTVVIVGPYEHHSNILPWRHLGVTLHAIQDRDDGMVDIAQLENRLKSHVGSGKRMIVSMSAASNVTGILADVEAITRITHKYGALSFWDYATAGPYLKIDMNPSSGSYKDAVFISPHKFVGGISTPGVLVAKRKLFDNAVPGNCGGGTVTYVTKKTHEFLTHIEEREEGGTPEIVGAIRAGLTFQLKDAMSIEKIEAREHELAQKAFRVWRHNKNIHILGSYTAERLPIFSMMFFHPNSGRFLHHNYMCQLLSDLYGIQVRGGCACAGPYAEGLLGISEETAMLFAMEFLSYKTHTEETKLEIMKPGFLRLNLPYFMPDHLVDYVINAVDMVATHGWALLHLYTLNLQTGIWTYCAKETNIICELKDFRLEGGKLVGPKPNTARGKKLPDLKTINREAKNMMNLGPSLLNMINKIEKKSDNMYVELPPRLERTLWFLTPKEALHTHTSNSNGYVPRQYDLPFWPEHRRYDRARKRFLAGLKKMHEVGLLSKLPTCVTKKPLYLANTTGDINDNRRNSGYVNRYGDVNGNNNNRSVILNRKPQGTKISVKPKDGPWKASDMPREKSKACIIM